MQVVSAFCHHINTKCLMSLKRSQCYIGSDNMLCAVKHRITYQVIIANQLHRTCRTTTTNIETCASVIMSSSGCASRCCTSLCWSYLTAIRRVYGVIDIGCVAPQFLQHLARFYTMHSYKPVIGAAEHMCSIFGEVDCSHSLGVCSLILA